MMIKNLAILFLFLVLSACCKHGSELGPYLLTDIEKAYIPYLTNESIPFIHSNGFEFDLVATGRQVKWRMTDTEHCGDNWSKYETLIYDLNSASPQFHIKLEVYPSEIDHNILISINRKAQFRFYFAGVPDIDTLTINGNLYSNIYDTKTYYSDTLIISPNQILYNKEVGIIQISMSDSTKFTINE